MAIQQGLTLRGWHYIHWGGRAMVHIMGCMYTYSIPFRIWVPSLSFVPWLSMYLAFSMIKIQVLRQPSLVRLYCASCPILWTVLKLGVILSGCQTFNTFENRFFFLYIFIKIFFCLFVWSRNFWHQICVQGPYLMRIDNLYLTGKMVKSISLDSVRSSSTCPANLGVQSCPVRKLICPLRSSPTLYKYLWLETSI